MSPDEEKRIISAAAKGDAEAFEALVKSHEKAAYRLALRSLGNEADAMDAVQEAFIKVWQALPSFRGDSKFSVWFYRILSNCCTDILRRRKTEALSMSSLGDENEPEPEIADSRPGPQEELEKRERSLALQKALERIPEDQRRVLLMREVSGLSYEEIGEALDLDLGTVKSRIFRGRKKLCTILSEDGNFFEKIPSDSRKGGVQI